MTNQHVLLLVVALGLLLEAPVALGQGAAPAGDAVDTFPTCGHVRPLVRAGSKAEEQYWSAVPTNRLLIPVQYEQFAAASPAPEDILAGLTVQVLNTEGEVPGVVVAAERLANAGSYVVTWVPDEPMTPGQHLQANVTAGTYPDPEECAILYADFSFIFTVSEQSPKEWLATVELTLRDAQLSCCTQVPMECCQLDGDAGAGYQCWDKYETPQVYVEWSAPGIVYAYLDVEGQSTNLVGGSGAARLGATLPMMSSGAVAEVFALTGYGDFCVEGTISMAPEDPVQLTRCSESAAETIRHGEEVPCRSRMPATSCGEPPLGVPALGVLHAVQGPSEAEARTALQSMPYHPSLGCYDAAPAEPTDAATSSSNSGDGDPLGPDERPEAVAPRTDSGCSLRAPVSGGGLTILVALSSLLLLRRRQGSTATRGSALQRRAETNAGRHLATQAGFIQATSLTNTHSAPLGLSGRERLTPRTTKARWHPLALRNPSG